jgi:uncharacterized protein (TIGR02300 family)
MAKPELGTKRQCVACGTRFYDLTKVPAVCPKCGTEQPAEQPRARRPGGGAAELRSRAKAVPVPEPVAEEVEIDTAEEAEEEEEVLEDTSDLEDGDADLSSDIIVEEPDAEEER